MMHENNICNKKKICVKKIEIFDELYTKQLYFDDYSNIFFKLS